MTFFCHPGCPTVQGWIDGERTEGMHTPEPWMVDPDDRPGYEWNNHIVSATDPNQTICFMTHDNTAENIEGEANARRIVACVNACKGIKTESLEMEVLSWITDETGENPLQRERDELLEARRACGERLIEVEQERDEARRQTEIVENYLEAATGKLAELIEARRALGEELAATKHQRDELLAGRLVEEPLRRQIAELREKVDAGGPAIWQQPLQKLGARLAELLDEDQFAECEALLLAAGVKPYNA